MYCMHYVLYALCTVCTMHCMHYALYALCTEVVKTVVLFVEWTCAGSEPPKVKNSKSTFKTGNLTVFYTCNDGYRINGSQENISSSCRSKDRTKYKPSWEPVQSTCSLDLGKLITFFCSCQ